MHLETILALFRYNDWANERMFDALATVPAPDVERDLGDAQGSLGDTATHIVWSEWIWLQRWTGATNLVFQPADFARVPPALIFRTGDFHDVAGLRERWLAVAGETRLWLGSLSSDRLLQETTYATVDGGAWRRPLWRQLVHAVNHSTYHRGQVAKMLRRLGHTPTGTDFVSFDD